MDAEWPGRYAARFTTARSPGASCVGRRAPNSRQGQRNDAQARPDHLGDFKQQHPFSLERLPTKRSPGDNRLRFQRFDERAIRFRVGNPTGTSNARAKSQQARGREPARGHLALLDLLIGDTDTPPNNGLAQPVGRPQLGQDCDMRIDGMGRTDAWWGDLFLVVVRPSPPDLPPDSNLIPQPRLGNKGNAVPPALGD